MSNFTLKTAEGLTGRTVRKVEVAERGETTPQRHACKVRGEPCGKLPDMAQRRGSRRRALAFTILGDYLRLHNLYIITQMRRRAFIV